MKKYIIANWKSNKSSATTRQWLDVFCADSRLHAMHKTRELVLIPSFVQLALVADAVKEYGIKVGVQDLSPFPAGSYTGAVSAQNVGTEQVEYVLLGHSERRLHFGDTDEIVAKKVELALDAGITPILCIDEPYLESQSQAIDPALYPRLLLAYEPLLAIGTGNRVSVGKVTQVKEKAEALFGEVPVIYGGSVDENSVAEYLLVCDGVLVGSASLRAEQFMAVITKGTPL